MRKLSFAFLVFGCAACASSGAIPREIIDARDAYSRAAAGPGLELAPAQLHVARLALDRAEEALAREGDSSYARDLAYIAERRAQVAESIAGSELARAQRSRAEKLLAQLQTEQAQRAVADAQAEMERAHLRTEAALNQLTSLRGALARDERGLVISLASNLLFGPNSAQLRPAAQRRLNEIAQTLVGPAAGEILIEGHTDASGSPRLNAGLAQQRAEAVADYLVKKGVPRGRLSAQARGPGEPVASNASAEGRATNRRVEIVVRNVAAATR